MFYSRLPSRSDGSRCSRHLGQLTKRLSQAACRGPDGLHDVLPQLVGHIADQRNLFPAVEHLRREGGRAPGPDGLRIDELSKSETWDLIRNLRAAILAGTYRHGRIKKRQIPKPAGRGFREIVVKNLRDRIAARGIAQVIEPLLDAGFDDASYCRTGRGQQVAVADALNLAEGYKLHTWVVADVADAFGSVPVERLRNLLAKRLPDRSLLALIDRILAGNPGKGLLQGCPLSMLCLNVFLDRLLDQKWRQQAPRWPLLRYVDDMLILCPTSTEAHDAYGLLQKFMREAGCKLKNDEPSAVRDLTIGERAAWLGLRFDLGDEGIRVRLPLDEEPGGFWGTFQDRLLKLHERSDAALLFPQVIEGKFLVSAAPTFPHHSIRNLYDRVRSLARDYGFEEMPAVEYFNSRWCAEYIKWDYFRKGQPLSELGPGEADRSTVTRATPASDRACVDAVPIVA